MAVQQKKRLGDMLVELGTITQKQLEGELKNQKVTGKRLGELLIEDGLITENEMLSLLEVQLGIPRVYLDMIAVDEQAVKTIPQSLALRYNLIPISFDEDKINVVMADPLNIFALDDVKIASGYEVEPMLSTELEIRKAIDRYYSTQVVKKAADELSKEQSVRSEEQNRDENEFDDIRNAPVVKLIDTIIDNAVKARTSDIHLEPFENFVKIRYRIDGELQEVLRTPKDTMGALVTRIKILANLNIAEKRIPQDGRIITQADGKAVDLRISSLPTVHGEKIVIRILKRDSFLVPKEDLGLIGEEAEKLEEIIKSPHGIILVTGPTGSGKSTTLYTILNDLNKPNRNIITVEDPVEYSMEGINQVNVNTKAGLTFAAGLRSILRQDPDVIMIGEIRDNETAEIAIRAAITGHLVLSTIHTNDASSTVYRLIDMGIEPYLVATSLNGIISQRLVRKICPKCMEEYEATSYEKNMLEIPVEESLTLGRGRGCKHCNDTGYKGRIAAFEIINMDREIREAVMNGVNLDEFRDLCMARGMKTLRESCKKLVLDGITTADELVKIAYLKE
ncbi:Flp pilus assembly complex ATPase component TadA [Clostridium sp. YIM B02515]|uniref:Flp pilus assembly complex ATPase component TadA n=1 Tax=Clostridium rhizosphaerae TaxID=2803861 RepID=A0ABS1TFW6_9CLOT|nr:GspE/PulE family protein [Clostridium rhizosphaerae]MBL4937204.1 Flp pilus assembly complex ATPase component TadA [Clostridium rhizosphaerae]